MRMVRRGCTPNALRMRNASIIDPAPVALSVAPVPACHESKCPPMSTISSLSLGSVPGISAMMLKPFGVVSSWNFTRTSSSTLTGTPLSRMRTILL